LRITCTGLIPIPDPVLRERKLIKQVMRRLSKMEKHNDREDIVIIPSPTIRNQIEVKHTPVEDINRLWEELTLDEIGKSLRELNISPAIFFKLILEKLLKDHVKRHQLKRWFEQEIINRAVKEEK
jgi:hypothetical protein